MEVNQLLSANTSLKDLLFGRLIARCSFQGAGKDLRKLSGRGEITLRQGRIEECELSRSLAELLETPRLKRIPLKNLKVHFEINQS
jgi:hypothetical protein